jgi:peptide-methionine (S)-S-oxide reductase
MQLSAMKFLRRLSPFPLAALILAATLAAAAFPEPPNVPTAPKGTDTVVLAGGCFWGMELVFSHLKGVKNVVAGYAGGSKADAQYEIVSTGKTGHAESVKITFDPAEISFGQLLKVYFSVAHDPTTLDYQGNDQGPQYRSAIFYTSEDQKKVAEAYISELNAAKVYRNKIVTRVVSLPAFYMAEEHHQNFAARNPTYPYIVFVDMPKFKHLKEQYPEMVKGK